MSKDLIADSQQLTVNQAKLLDAFLESVTN